MVARGRSGAGMAVPARWAGCGGIGGTLVLLLLQKKKSPGFIQVHDKVRKKKKIPFLDPPLM